jgi:predicted outer membrane repeat protein
MTHLTWLTNLLTRRRASSPGRSASARRSQPPLRVEVLEGRLVLATLTVTNLLDSGPGSLREKVGLAANGDTIHFMAGLTGTITLTTGELQLSRSVTITGPGANVLGVSGHNASRVFEVVAGATDAVSGLTITAGQPGGSSGGGVLVDTGGTLALTSSALSDNSARSVGGGLFNNGTVTVTESTLSGNSSGTGGGGIYNTGTLTVIGSTFSGNSAPSGGGIYSTGTLTVTGSTLSGNSASVSVGGGIIASSLPATLRDTIVAGNLRGSSPDDISGTVSAASSYNLIGTGGSGGLINGVNHNLVGVANPGLGMLADNGGPTRTIALLSGSPAVGAGDPSLAGTHDQRGVVRHLPVSVGAYQDNLTATALVGSVGTSAYGWSVTFTATVTSGGSPVTVGSVTFTDGTATLGTVDLDADGQAALSTDSLSVSGSPHTLTATFNPGMDYLASSGTTGLTVTPALTTITADDQARAYGSANPALTVQYAGFVLGQNPSVLRGTLTVSTTATQSSEVGTYPITASGLTSGNYQISYVAGTLTVTPAALTITADDKTKVAGNPVPTLTASYAGFVNGDTPDSLTTPVSLSTYTGETAGTYPIDPSGASSSNYTISYVHGTLTVTPASAMSLQLVPPTTVTAGQGFDVTVRALDPYGNVDPGYVGTFRLTSTDPQAPDLGMGTFTTGNAGVVVLSGLQLYTVGSWSIQASGVLSGQADLTVVSTTVARVALTAASSAVAGIGFSGTITAYDRYGNVATGYAGTVTLTSADPQAPDLGSYTFTSGDAGLHVFNGLRLFTVGMWTVSASDGSFTAQAAMTVTPGMAAALVLTGPASATAGMPFAVTVTAYDGWGNLATGYTGTVSFSSNDTDAGLPSNYVFQPGDQGVASFHVTFRTPGSRRVNVTDTLQPAVTGFLDVTLL